MLTLGIHDGHTATACVMEDGKVLACISEERLNRKKEWEGFPELSIKKCLEITKKTPEQFDAIGFSSLMPLIGNSTYERPLWTKRLFGYLVNVLPSYILQQERNIKIVQAIGQYTSKKRCNDLINRIQALGFSCPYDFYEHHFLHAATSYYTNWHRPEKCLIITLDGSGDGVCGSVNIGENGKIKRIAGLFNYNSICEFYTKITQHLGMKPMSHEYKVMGMAPYADEKYRSELVSLFRQYYRISRQHPLQIINTSGKWKWQFFNLFKKELFQKRFDNISGAVQDLFEEIVLAWVKNAISKTGIHDIALSGGGFMNVKLNGKILNLDDVNSLFIFPSCGDESNSIGAGIMAALTQGYDHQEIKPLDMVYWGPEYSNDDVKSAIDRLLPSEGYAISFHDDIDQLVGKEVAKGKIVGRMTGRMEWGARAMGNRSIIADPRSQNVIHRINKAIKMRDFWMPFAPAILLDWREKYLKIKDHYYCPFMTIGVETTKRAHTDIIAGLHPFDLSARPQVVDQDFHPGFYRVIKVFEQETGVGGVLNTSFNLHGDAIVCTPEDAINTFLNSDLDSVQIQNYYIERKPYHNAHKDRL